MGRGSSSNHDYSLDALMSAPRAASRYDDIVEIDDTRYMILHMDPESDVPHSFEYHPAVEIFNGKRIEAKIWMEQGLVSRDEVPAIVRFNDQGEIRESQWVKHGELFDGPYGYNTLCILGNGVRKYVDAAQIAEDLHVDHEDVRWNSNLFKPSSMVVDDQGATREIVWEKTDPDNVGRPSSVSYFEKGAPYIVKWFVDGEDLEHRHQSPAKIEFKANGELRYLAYYFEGVLIGRIECIQGVLMSPIKPPFGFAFNPKTREVSWGANAPGGAWSGILPHVSADQYMLHSLVSKNIREAIRPF